MEPKLPAQERGPELPSVSYGQNLERAPTLPTPETTIERAPERFEQRSEAAPAAVTQAPVLPPVVVPPAVTPASDDSATAASDDMPVVANDDDLIEREWVDKAKKIITETKDDPYRREQEVGKLQAEYLRKRYGRELGASQ
jgi:Txe/YoeB family toxin of Txe-Axe toxin-antitoxin module